MLFLLYRETFPFCAIFGAWKGEGGMAAFGPFGSIFEGHSSSPPANTYMCSFTEFKEDTRTDYLQKVHANISCIDKLYHRLKKTFPSRSRDSLIDSLTKTPTLRSLSGLQPRTPVHGTPGDIMLTGHRISGSRCEADHSADSGCWTYQYSH